MRYLSYSINLKNGIFVYNRDQFFGLENAEEDPDFIQKYITTRNNKKEKKKKEKEM